MTETISIMCTKIEISLCYCLKGKCEFEMNKTSTLHNIQHEDQTIKAQNIAFLWKIYIKEE